MTDKHDILNQWENSDKSEEFDNVNFSFSSLTEFFVYK